MSMDALSAARLVETLAYNLYLSTLGGSEGRRPREIREDISNPKPGDLVIETSTIYAAKASGGSERGVTGIGRLIRVADEPVATREEWDDEDPIPTHKVYYIELVFGEGVEQRWHNASFIKVPETIYSYFK